MHAQHRKRSLYRTTNPVRPVQSRPDYAPNPALRSSPDAQDFSAYLGATNIKGRALCYSTPVPHPYFIPLTLTMTGIKRKAIDSRTFVDLIHLRTSKFPSWEPTRTVEVG